MKNSRIQLLFIGVFISTSVFSQGNIPLGVWRTHFNYNNTFLIEEVGQKIFAAASSGLTFYDKEDNSLNKLSKIDGLSEVSASALAYDQENNRLVIGYENGNIDIMDDTGISNNRILIDSDVTQSKRIHQVSF